MFAAVLVMIVGISAMRGSRRSTTTPLPEGVPALWPITVAAFERPATPLGVPGRRSGRRPWDWQQVAITVTAERVTVVDADGVAIEAPRADVGVELISGGTATKFVCGDVTLCLEPTNHKTFQRLPLGEFTYLSRLLHHQIALALIGQAQAPSEGQGGDAGESHPAP